MMYKEDENEDIDIQKERIITTIEKMKFCKKTDINEDELIDESSVEAAISFLIDSYSNTKGFDDEMFDAFQHFYNYTKTDEGKFLDCFTNSKFISVLINAIKQRIPALQIVIWVITNMWYLCNSDKEQVLFDDELIDTLTELFVEVSDSDAKYEIIRAFVNCVYDNPNVCQYILMNPEFVEQFSQIFYEGDNIALLAQCLKLLFLFIHCDNDENECFFYTLFEPVASMLKHNIPVIAISSTKCFKAFIEKHTKLFIDEYKLQIFEMALNPLVLGFTECMIPVFQILSILLNYNESCHAFNYEQLQNVFLKDKVKNFTEQNDENSSEYPEEEDVSTYISQYKFINTIRHVFYRFSQDSSEFLYTFLTQSNPFMYQVYFDERIIAFIFDTIEHTSFRNRDPAISYLCDFFMTCKNEIIRGEIGNSLLEIILDNIVSDNINPSLFRWLQVVHDLIHNLSDYDADRIIQTMEEIIEEQEDESCEDNPIVDIAQDIISLSLQIE